MTAGTNAQRFVGHLMGVGRVRVHPLFFALVVGAYFAHMLGQACVLFGVVILHELGHAVAAKRLGYKVEEVALLPFGGVAKLAYGRLGFKPKDEAIVAIAGPVVNLALVVIGTVFHLFGMGNRLFYETWMQSNIWIGVFNLLPALPLDGGRILRAAESRRIGFERATVEAYQVAFALAVLLMLLGTMALFMGKPHIGMVLLGVFLFVTAWRGRRDLRRETMQFLDAKRRSSKYVMKMSSLAVSERSTIRDTVLKFAPDRYHIVYVIGADGLVKAIIEEIELLDAVFEGNWLESIGSLVHDST